MSPCRRPRTRTRTGVAGVLALLSGPVLAQTSSPGPQVAAGYLAQLLGGLALVVLLILLLAWVVRRMPGATGPGRQMIEILAVRSVGARERLLLVQVGREQILIGMTPAGIHHLHTLQEPLEPLPSEPAPADFATLLKRLRSGGMG